MSNLKMILLIEVEVALEVEEEEVEVKAEEAEVGIVLIQLKMSKRMMIKKCHLICKMSLLLKLLSTLASNKKMQKALTQALRMQTTNLHASLI